MTPGRKVNAFPPFYNPALWEYATVYPFFSFCPLLNSVALNILDQKCKKQIAIQMVVPMHMPTSSKGMILYLFKPTSLGKSIHQLIFIEHLL